MAGRNRGIRQSDGYYNFRAGPRPRLHQGPGPLPPHPAALEEEFEIRHRDIQRMLAENRLVIDDNVVLERELSAAKDDMHRLSQVIPKLRADKEAQTRELIERGLKLEAELRTVEPLRSEIVQLRTEVQKLNALRQDLSGQVQNLTKDTVRLQSENKQIESMRSDIDDMHKELAEARRIFEYEKKANEEQMEQKQAMEKNLVSVAREIEKLRAEQVTADRRAQGLGSGSYGVMNGSPEMRYLRGAYDDPYGGGSWGHHYDKRGHPRR